MARYFEFLSQFYGFHLTHPRTCMRAHTRKRSHTHTHTHTHTSNICIYKVISVLNENLSETEKYIQVPRDSVIRIFCCINTYLTQINIVLIGFK
jgi:hypothetical protein